MEEWDADTGHHMDNLQRMLKVEEQPQMMEAPTPQHAVCTGAETMHHIPVRFGEGGHKQLDGEPDS